MEPYNIALLTDKQMQRDFQLELLNRYTALQDLEEGNGSPESKWLHMKKVWLNTCKCTVGMKKRKHQERITPETLSKVETRKKQKEVI